MTPKAFSSDEPRYEARLGDGGWLVWDQRLPVRDELIEEGVNGADTPCMTTAWHPDPAELERLVNGAAVHIRILGTVHPPIMVEVGDAPAEGELA